MTEATLTDAEARQRGLELSIVLAALAIRKGWTPGDGLAVATVAYCELAARTAGRVQAITFLRDQADALEDAELGRGTIPKPSIEPRPDCA